MCVCVSVCVCMQGGGGGGRKCVVYNDMTTTAKTGVVCIFLVLQYVDCMKGFKNNMVIIPWWWLLIFVC